MAGAVGQLASFVVIDDAARQTVRACLAWEAEVRDADGDRERAGKLRATLRQPDDLGRL